MKQPTLINNAIITYENGFAVDADGSPRAYGPNNSGLDYTNNGGSPGNWYGILTDQSGNPIIQGPNDPYPNMYISPTSLQDHTKSRLDTTRYVDSENVPYVAVASDLIKLYGIKMADIAYVYNKNTNAGYGAVVADAGPRGKYSEGSIYLAKQLGLKNTSPRNGGCANGIVTLIFLNSHSSWPLSNDIIQELALDLLQQNGGINLFL